MAISRSKVLLAVAATGCLAVGLAAQLPAYAAGPGTWTSITSPRDGASFLDRVGHEREFTLTGRVSSDVTQVNVYCLAGGISGEVVTVATSVVVSARAFTATVPVPSDLDQPQCRLRALPTGVSPQGDYLASYAGPVVDFDSWQTSGTDYQLRASVGGGMAVASSIGACATTFLATVLADQSVPGGSDGCLLGLGRTSITPTGSTVTVDGRPAFTATGAADFGLVPTRAPATRFALAAGGSVRWTEDESLDRCTTAVAYPYSGCTPVATGVEIRQVSTLLASGHQVRIRTTLRSLDDAKHTVRLSYYNHADPTAAGEVGFRFPGQQKFRASTTGQEVSIAGTGSGTMLIRSDRLASESDPFVSTRALTWSRTPSNVTFGSSDSDDFALAYRLTVPRGGSVHLGFADSEGITTRAATRLGARGVADMVARPRITIPARGAVIEGRTTKVAGVVVAGANGLPVSVRVDGHAATLKPNRARTRATYAVTFAESLGRHTVTVVARDVVGNRRSASVTVTNR